MLTAFYNGVDISREQSRFEFLPTSVNFDGEFLFIGYVKPISHFHLNITARTSVGSPELAVEYWIGSAWASVTGLKDFTFGLTRPGPVHWNKNQANETKTTQEGIELFWYRLALSEAVTVTFKGIGPLFSEDGDLVQVYPDIMDKLPTGQTSFVRFHDEAVKDIVKDLRKMGLVIDGERLDPSARKQIDAYDLLDRDEVREAAKYFTLSKIFYWLSDQPGDNWEKLAAKYESEAAGSMTPLITIDTDDNGLLDDFEKAQPQPMIIGRL